MSDFKEYPKAIYQDGRKPVIVNNKAEEDKLTAPVEAPADNSKKPKGWDNN